MPRNARVTAAALLALALGACSTLPSSGPTASEIRSAQAEANPLGFAIVPVRPNTLVAANLAGKEGVAPLGMDILARDAPVDLIGPGDVLNIAIYEVGVTLFQSNQTGIGGDSFDPSARDETIKGITVNRDGRIKLPYIGVLDVAGRTADEVQVMIERGLRGQSQAPQAVVSVARSVTNQIYVSGAVQAPGRLPLSLARERLRDAIASAGGPTKPAENIVVVLSRDNRRVEMRLSDIEPGSANDISLQPSDRISLYDRPRTYTVFGAAGGVGLKAFDAAELSLAQAVARAGGPSDSSGDPSAVFLFRFERDLDAPGGERPVAYLLDMRDPTSYFLAQRFIMRNEDVIYIANAPANQPGKLISIINQLFSPLITARAITR